MLVYYPNAASLTDVCQSTQLQSLHPACTGRQHRNTYSSPKHGAVQVSIAVELLPVLLPVLLLLMLLQRPDNMM